MSPLGRASWPWASPGRWSRFTPGVTFLLVVVGAVHLALFGLRLLDEEFFQFLFFGAALLPERLLAGEVWRLVTMMFLHDPHNLFHIVMNMLLLYSLGPWVERAMTLKPFLTLYFVAGVTGSLLHSAWAALFSDPSLPAVGASGAVLGVMTAFSLLFPDAQLRLWFFAPLRGRSLILVAVAIDFIAWLSDPRIAVAAHLGGILGAFAYLRRPWRGVGGWRVGGPGQTIWTWRKRFRWRVERFLRTFR